MSFIDAFARSYQMFAPDPAEQERIRQNKGYTTLMDFLKTQQADAQRTQSQNDLYSASQQFAGMNPDKPKFEFNSSLMPQEKGFTSSLMPPEQKPSLASLVPTAKKAVPQYNDNEMYGAVEQVLKKGVDASIAMPFLQNYYGKKRGEIDQKALDDEYNGMMSGLQGLDFNDPKSRAAAYFKIGAFDRKAKSMGKPGADMDLIGKIVKSGAFEIKQKKIAGPDGVTMIQDVMVPVGGGYLPGPDGKLVVEAPMGQPYRIGMSEEAKRGLDLRANDQNFQQSLVFEKRNQAVAHAPNDLQPLFAQAAAEFGVPASILEGVASAESSFNPGAMSPVGAIGLMQLMPETAQGLGVNPHDPAQNVRGGAKYLRQMYDSFGDWKLAFAAYNAGPGAVEKAINRAGSRSWEAVQAYLPQETRNYVPTVFQRINAPPQQQSKTGNYIQTPLGNMTPAQVLSAYKEAKGGTVTTTDQYGNARTKEVPADPQLMALFNPLVKNAYNGLAQGSPVDQNAMINATYANIDKAIKDNVSREGVIQLVLEDAEQLKAFGIDPQEIIRNIEWPQQNQRARVLINPNENPGAWMK